MANSHFKVFIAPDAHWHRYYLYPFLLHHLPGVQLQEAGKLSDQIHCVINTPASSTNADNERFRKIPNLKIVLITGEPNAVTENFVHLIIDCKRDARLRPANVPSVYLP